MVSLHSHLLSILATLGHHGSQWQTMKTFVLLLPATNLAYQPFIRCEEFFHFYLLSPSVTLGHPSLTTNYFCPVLLVSLFFSTVDLAIDTFCQTLNLANLNLPKSKSPKRGTLKMYVFLLASVKSHWDKN